MGTQPSILVLENDAASAALIADTFRTHAPDSWRVTHAPVNLQPPMFALPIPPGESLPALVITDAAAARRLAGPSRPFGLIALLNINEQSSIRELIAKGVDDVLVRVPGYLDQLPAVAASTAARRGRAALALNEAERVAELKAMLELINEENHQLHLLIDRLETMALSDPLTGLANRRAMQGRLEEEFAASVRETHDVSMMMIDVDGLKTVNDRLGHAAGDELLVLAAKTLVDGSRRSDITCRVGGDEFVIILPRTTRAAARPVAERLCASFRKAAEPIAAQLRSLIGDASDRCVGISIGLASRIDDGSETGEQLLARADVSLYKAKGQRLGVAVFSENEPGRSSPQGVRSRTPSPALLTPSKAA